MLTYRDDFALYPGPPKETNLIVQTWIESKMFEISSTYQDLAQEARK